MWEPHDISDEDRRLAELNATKLWGFWQAELRHRRDSQVYDAVWFVVLLLCFILGASAAKEMPRLGATACAVGGAALVLGAGLRAMGSTQP